MPTTSSDVPMVAFGVLESDNVDSHDLGGLGYGPSSPTRSVSAAVTKEPAAHCKSSGRSGVHILANSVYAAPVPRDVFVAHSVATGSTAQGGVGSDTTRADVGVTTFKVGWCVHVTMLVISIGLVAALVVGCFMPLFEIRFEGAFSTIVQATARGPRDPLDQFVLHGEQVNYPNRSVSLLNISKYLQEPLGGGGLTPTSAPTVIPLTTKFAAAIFFSSVVASPILLVVLSVILWVVPINGFLGAVFLRFIELLRAGASPECALIVFAVSLTKLADLSKMIVMKSNIGFLCAAAEGPLKQFDALVGLNGVDECLVLVGNTQGGWGLVVASVFVFYIMSAVSITMLRRALASSMDIPVMEALDQSAWSPWLPIRTLLLRLGAPPVVRLVAR